MTRKASTSLRDEEMVWRVGGPIGSTTAPVRIDAWQWSWQRSRHKRETTPELEPQDRETKHKRARARDTSSQPTTSGNAAPSAASEASPVATTAVWVMASTHQCALSGCVPCRAKVLQSAGATSVPNARPESCPRFVPESAHRPPPRGAARPIGLYSPGQRILTVGDGDLTFTLALARVLGGDRLVASSYEVCSSSSRMRTVPPRVPACHLPSIDSLPCTAIVCSTARR